MRKIKFRLSFPISALFFCSLAFALLLCACTKDKPEGKSSAELKDSAYWEEHTLGPTFKTTLETFTQKQFKLDSFFRALHHKQGFNGTVLVAQQGQVLYRGAFGYGDFEKKDTLTTQTLFQLASVTKPFTALAILMLKEKGVFSLQDSVYRYLPSFPYRAITIRQLLTHSSGLPDYLYMSKKYYPKDNELLTNYELIERLFKHKPALLFTPGSRYAYSNTGYLLLAALIEKASGMSYGKFLNTKIFQPLGMKHTGVLSLINPLNMLARGHTSFGRPIKNDYLDLFTGDKGLYSTVEDLFLWDQGLYSEKLLKQSTLVEAFKGNYKVNVAEDYGFGWRVRILACGQQVLYHTGRWHGFRSYLMRNLKDHSTVVILSNVDKSIDPEFFQYILYP